MASLLIRKTTHFLFGIIAIILIYRLPQLSTYLFALAAILFLIFDLWRRKEGKWKNLFYHLFNKILKPSERGGQLSGATTFLMTVAAIPFFFTRDVVVVSILVLSVSDPLASIAGQWQPIKKIRKEKSLMGSTVFFLSGLIIFQFFISQSLIYVLITALLTTLVELLAPEMIENIAIGFSAAFIIAPIM
jgi:dolichol kinase